MQDTEFCPGLYVPTDKTISAKKQKYSLERFLFYKVYFSMQSFYSGFVKFNLLFNLNFK